MNKQLLIRHIKGETTPAEARRVQEWISRSQRNESYYVSLLNIITIQEATGKTDSCLSSEDMKRNYASVNAKILMGQRRKSRIYGFVACAAVALLALSVLLNISQSNAKRSIENEGIAEKVYPVTKSFFTAEGMKGKIILPDSTVVWMEPNSRISYPERFSEASRDVIFEGEGYFEVVKNPARPMVITTPKGMAVKVFGTKLLIKSKAADNSEKATLISGKMQVLKKKEKIDIKPGESVSFDENGTKIDTTTAKTFIPMVLLQPSRHYDPCILNIVAKNYDGGEVYVVCKSVTGVDKYPINIINGVGSVSLRVCDLAVGTLCTENGTSDFFIEPGKTLSAALDFNSVSSLRMQGSDMNRDFALLESSVSEKKARLEAMDAAIAKCGNLEDLKRARLSAEREKLASEISDETLGFEKNYPQCVETAKLFNINIFN